MEHVPLTAIDDLVIIDDGASEEPVMSPFCR